MVGFTESLGTERVRKSSRYAPALFDGLAHSERCIMDTRLETYRWYFSPRHYLI